MLDLPKEALENHSISYISLIPRSSTAIKSGAFRWHFTSRKCIQSETRSGSFLGQNKWLYRYRYVVTPNTCKKNCVVSFNSCAEIELPFSYAHSVDFKWLYMKQKTKIHDSKLAFHVRAFFLDSSAFGSEKSLCFSSKHWFSAMWASLASS